MRQSRSGFSGQRGLLQAGHLLRNGRLPRDTHRGVEGEDVAQDAYVRAAKYIGETEKLELLPGSLEDARPWLLRVARNLALDRRRVLNRSRTSELVIDPPAPAAKPESEEETPLRHCLKQLPANERAVIGVFLDGNKPARIAELLELPVKSVYYLLRRARENLLRCLTAAGVRDLSQ